MQKTWKSFNLNALTDSLKKKKLNKPNHIRAYSEKNGYMKYWWYKTASDSEAPALELWQSLITSSESVWVAVRIPSIGQIGFQLFLYDRTMYRVKKLLGLRKCKYERYSL